MAIRPNAKSNWHLEKLEAERQERLARVKALESEVSALMGEVRGIERAMELIRGTSPSIASASKQTEISTKDTVGAEDTASVLSLVRSPRGFVKDAVLKLVTEHAERGLVAAELVELAAARGIRLDRGSVSSLLSRLKQEGTLDYVDGRYKPAASLSPQKAQGQNLA